MESEAQEGGHDTYMRNYKSLQNFEATNMSGSSIGQDP